MTRQRKQPEPQAEPPPHNPHDAAFRAMTAVARSLRALVCDRLPPELRDQVVSVRRIEGTFIDPPTARRSESDCLAEVTFKNGEVALAYALLEHWSRPDPLALTRTARYMLSIWERYLREKPALLRKKLPPIIPIIYYHGKAKWDIPRLLDGMHPLGGELVGMEVRCLAVNMAETPSEELSSDDYARATMFAAGYVTGARRATLEQLLALLPENVHLAADVVDYVIMSGRDDAATVSALLAKVQPERVEEIMQAVKTQWEIRGEARGEARGRAEGEARARMEMLEEHLRRRFKSIPKRIQARIAEASAQQLKAWFDAAYDAPSLKAVFAD